VDHSVQVGARAVGARVHRVEDARILTGTGRYVDDVAVPGMLHAAFLRSQVPHGRLLSLDTTEAAALPGVVAVYTGRDMERLTEPAEAGSAIGMTMVPGLRSPKFHALATDKVRYVGDPIAMVVAEDRYIAEDALELLVEDIAALDPVVTYEDALDPAKPPLFDELGENVALTTEMTLGDVEAAFAKADRVVPATLSVHRHQPVPMEGRGIVAVWDAARQRLTLHSSTQSPHMIRLLMAPQLRVPMESIRVLAGDVGGGFGLKNAVSREEVAVAAAAIDLGRPVKWVEDRFEHLAASGQAREEMAEIETAVTGDGLVLAIRMKARLNAGAYPSDPFPGAFFVTTLSAMFQGPLRLEGLQASHTSVFSNKATYASYRGPWATADFLRERLLDVVACHLGMDPLEIRRRNYVERDQPPLAMLTGLPFSGVTTREQVEEAARIVDWDGFRAHQETLRAEGRLVGIGIASYLEAAPGPRGPMRNVGVLGDETTRVWVDDQGQIVVVTRQQPHGQGHETTLSQVASDELGVDLDQVRIIYGDTDITPFAVVGTGGSRAATMANGAVLHASRDLRDKILSAAADELEASSDDLEIASGVVSVRGTPRARISLKDLVGRLREDTQEPGEPSESPLEVACTYDGGEGGWSGGTHCSIVEVDAETGLVKIDRYVVVEDCGEPVNPAIVEGQVRGGVAQGIGAVLLEHSAYGDDGQFLASTFMDYLMPTTTVVPNIEIFHVDTVPTDPDVNFRGVGEGGMIIAPACITNAIEDALAPRRAQVREQHLPPARVFELINTGDSV
jgi:aerobic carbon-monoxide dehydrogenase large subunit